MRLHHAVPNYQHTVNDHCNTHPCKVIVRFIMTADTVVYNLQERGVTLNTKATPTPYL